MPDVQLDLAMVPVAPALVFDSSSSGLFEQNLTPWPNRQQCGNRALCLLLTLKQPDQPHFIKDIVGRCDLPKVTRLGLVGWVGTGSPSLVSPWPLPQAAWAAPHTVHAERPLRDPA